METSIFKVGLFHYANLATSGKKTVKVLSKVMS